ETHGTPCQFCPAYRTALRVDGSAGILALSVRKLLYSEQRSCELGTIVLEAINLTCVRGERRLFHDLNVHVERGSGLFVQGPNGSGKRTLLRVFGGLTPPCGGAILWNGR